LMLLPSVWTISRKEFAALIVIIPRASVNRISYNHFNSEIQGQAVSRVRKAGGRDRTAKGRGFGLQTKNHANPVSGR
jgi:hypothetical protein